MAKLNIPEEILTAASGLLAKYVDLRALLLSAQVKKEEEQEKRYLTMEEVKQCYGISRWTLRRRIKDGLIKASKLSKARAGKVLIEKVSLETYLATANICISQQKQNTIC